MPGRIPDPALLPEQQPQQPPKRQLGHRNQAWGLRQRSQRLEEQEQRLQVPLSPSAGTQQQQGPMQPGPAALGQQRMQLRDSAADHLFKLLPEWVRHALQDKSRQLLYLERQMARHLAAALSRQADQLQPVLEARGRRVGEALLHAMVGGGGRGRGGSSNSTGGSGSSSSASGDRGKGSRSSDAQVSYEEVLATSLHDAEGGGLAVQELVLTLDPVLTPFIAPFVDGVKAPIYQEVQLVKREVEAGVAAAGAACLLAGFLLGRCLPRQGAGSCRGGGGGSKDSGGRVE